jgi:hypothetical protein
MAELEKNNIIDRNESLPIDNQLEPTKTVDTVHNDEALKVFVEYTGEREWTPAEENKLRRKIDWRLMPVLCMTYGLQYYDKAMLSQAVCRPLVIALDQRCGTNVSLRRYSDSEPI